jgi:hypothetical protein
MRILVLPNSGIEASFITLDNAACYHALKTENFAKIAVRFVL